MREPIGVKVESFNLRQTEPQINAAVQAFAEYAEHVPPAKSTRSKYGLLGPAGKAITELKSGRYDRNSLIGYTLRTQEGARAGQRVSELRLTAVNALEKAVDQILDVLRRAPEPYHSEILDRLDYGLYYHLRRQQIERKEILRQEWVRFLEKKYGAIEAIREAWKREVSAFDTLPLQKKQLFKGQRRSEAEQKDIQEFYATRTTQVPDEETTE